MNTNITEVRYLDLPLSDLFPRLSRRDDLGVEKKKWQKKLGLTMSSCPTPRTC
jgi:hypothetical protein